MLLRIPEGRLYVTHVVRTSRCHQSLPKPQPASNRVPLRESRCRPVSRPEAENATQDSLNASACPQHKDLGHLPAYATALMR